MNFYAKQIEEDFNNILLCDNYKMERDNLNFSLFACTREFSDDISENFCINVHTLNSKLSEIREFLFDSEDSEYDSIEDIITDTFSSIKNIKDNVQRVIDFVQIDESIYNNHYYNTQLYDSELEEELSLACLLQEIETGKEYILSSISGSSQGEFFYIILPKENEKCIKHIENLTFGMYTIYDVVRTDKDITEEEFDDIDDIDDKELLYVDYDILKDLKKSYNIADTDSVTIFSIKGYQRVPIYQTEKLQ